MNPANYLTEQTNVTVNAELPASWEAEVSLIGATILEPNVLNHTSHITAADFTDPNNALLWQHIKALWMDGRRPDILTIMATMPVADGAKLELQRTLADYAASVVSIIAAPDYARVIRDVADRRRLIEVATTLIEEAADVGGGSPAAEIASRAIADIDRAAEEPNEFEDAADVHKRILASLDKPIACYPTGLPRLDDALAGGLYPGRLYALTARHKAGKTTFLSTIAYNLAQIDYGQPAPIPTLYLSLEQDADEVMLNMIARAMSVPGGWKCSSTMFRQPNYRNDHGFRTRVADAHALFVNRKLYFRAKPRLSITDLKASLARIGLSRKVKVILLDYLQLVSGQRKGQSSAEHLDNVAQTLKEAASRYNIAIVVAAQLNSTGGIRGGEGLINACDALLALHRCVDADEVPRTLDGPTDHAGRPTGPIGHEAWMDMPICRYAPATNIGTNTAPAYRSDYTWGPHMIEYERTVAPQPDDEGAM